MPVTKRQQKLRRELEKKILKRDEEANKKKLRNKLKNERKQIRLEESKKAVTETRNEPDEIGDLRDQLRNEQKPGVSFPHDSCSSRNLTPEFEATVLTQYNLKKGLKEFGDDGLTALRKEVQQLYT
jgi:hypothetical protein